MENLLLLALIGAGVWFWIDSMNARERAIAAAARACNDVNVQLLDQTVALESIRPARNRAGHLVWRRVYAFEYSSQGVERQGGRAILRGRVLEQVQLDAAGGTTIEQHE
jgi:adenylyl- and sulfurtransferase ThiI